MCPPVRIDVRVSAAGRAFFLEMTPNSGVFYPPADRGRADHILVHTGSTGHSDFLRTILEAAIVRHRARQPRVCVKYLPASHSYGLIAARDFNEGEVVDALEERGVNLVTRRHVKGHWGEREARWFDRYAYPLNDEVHAMWSERPEEWKPLNHSCDPNTWLEGLNLVARRDIRRGDEITVEYAT